MQGSGRFRGEMLVLARKARMLSQVDISDEIVSQALISRYENNMVNPDDKIVEHLSGKLEFPVSFFYQNWETIGLPVSVHPNSMYRKRSALSAHALHSAEAMQSIFIGHIRTLLKSFNIKPELSIHEMEIEEFGTPEKIADSLRGFWNIPLGPIDNLTGLLEKAGILVVEVNFLEDGIDGITIRRHGLPPIIFMNSNVPGDRWRTTLAHELGHLVMHKTPSGNMEKEAYDFAGAFLMPRRDIAPMFKGQKIGLELLARLKPHWKVAMQAIAMRAFNIGAISEYHKKLLFINMSKRGYRRHEPVELDFPRERAELFPLLLRSHQESLGYSLDEMANMLNIYKKDMCEWYGLCEPMGGKEKVQLRRIK